MYPQGVHQHAMAKNITVASSEDHFHPGPWRRPDLGLCRRSHFSLMCHCMWRFDGRTAQQHKLCCAIRQTSAISEASLKFDVEPLKLGRVGQWG